MRASLQGPKDAAAAATRYGERALVAFRRANGTKDRRERMHNLYEAERLRCQALAHALLSPNYEETLTDLARMWEDASVEPRRQPRTSRPTHVERSKSIEHVRPRETASPRRASRHQP